MPGLNRWGFLTPVVTGADFRAIFCAISCFLGTFCAVDLRAVCFVRAICVLRGSFVIYYTANNLSVNLYELCCALKVDIWWRNFVVVFFNHYLLNTFSSILI